MLPTKSLGLLAFVLYAACIVALCWASFTSPARAAARGVRPYRGYVEVCVFEEGRPSTCLNLQTRVSYDNEALCIASVNSSLAAYRDIVLRTRPHAEVMARGGCRFGDGEYFA